MFYKNDILVWATEEKLRNMTSSSNLRQGSVWIDELFKMTKSRVQGPWNKISSVAEVLDLPKSFLSFLYDDLGKSTEFWDLYKF